MSSAAAAIVLVEKATSDLLLGPDWTTNIEICDSINLDPGLAKDVVKAVKKRLQHKSSSVQFLTLTLLETMFKNCGDFVHSLVVEKDILPEMVKIVRKKTDMEVRDKILVLLDSWQEAFGGPRGKYPQYFWAYNDLKMSGVEFPLHSDDAGLILAPSTHHTATPKLRQLGHAMPSNSAMSLDQAMASELTNFSLSDLDRIRRVSELLNDMLKAVNSHDQKAIEDEVITDLVDQCHSNQKMILQLIDSTGDEELLGEGLALNDNLQSLLAKYDAIISGSPLPYDTSASVQQPATTLSPAIAATNRFEEDEEEEDDEFSQLARRKSKVKPSSESTSTETNDINTTAPATRYADEAAVFRGNAWALPDPPRPVKTTTKDPNMIELLRSVAVSSSNFPPPHAPTSSPAFQQNESTETAIPHSSYVAPWVQPPPPSSSQPQPLPFHFRTEQQPRYLPHQQFQPEPPIPPHRPESRPELPPQYAGYPPPPWEESPNPNLF